MNASGDQVMCKWLAMLFEAANNSDTHTRTHAHIHIHTVRTEHRAQPFCSYMTAVTLLRTALAPVAAGAKPMRLLPTSNTV